MRTLLDSVDINSHLMCILPNELRTEIEQLVCSVGVGALNEVRLRAERTCTVTLDGKNIPLSYHVDGQGLQALLEVFCQGSVYAYRETLRQGYIPLANGGRVGVCGTAMTDGGRITGLSAVSSLSIRIPRRVAGAADAALSAWNAEGRRCGMLIASPPAVGKTTLLREIIVRLSSGEAAMRVAVVDTRGELCPDTAGEVVDVLRGYPRAAGLEIALRTLSPEVIVCDEICPADVDAVRETVHSGVPLLASIHGDSLSALIKRAGMKELLECGAFGLFCALERQGRRRVCRTEKIPCCG